MASSLHHHHLLLLLLLQNSIALSFTPNPSKKLQPFIFPLKTQKIPAMSLPRPSPNKLLFHHNVSLVVTLTVGSPPQNVSMVLDTGSELSWLNCKSHSDPTHKNPTFFNPSSSHTYYPFPCASPTCKTRTLDFPIRPTCAASGSCHVYLSYADASSAEGTLSSDLFSFTPSNPSKTIFGCMDSSFSSTTSDTSSIGLIGMNRGSLSLVSQMGTPKFSYCISGRDDTGVVLLGEAELPWLLPLNYTPLVEMSLPLPYFDRVAYSVQLQGIRVAQTVLPLPKSVLVPDHTGAGQTMFDSGTQFTFLLGPVYEALKIEFLKQTRGVLKGLGEPEFVFQGAFDTCFRVPAGVGWVGEGLPEVVLMFPGAEVAVTGERLLYRAEGEVRSGGAEWVYCMTFGNSDLVPMEAYVIGHHHQQNVWVEYDLKGGRVGFAPVRCDIAGQRLGAVV
ncbi:Aspartic proteinase PCS1 [Acorus calamus]|uniref:Aspartic proteinase PCS1 n=1 Tax=Acorus calamus TaxID=4465 RepID=A0AAV9F5Y7_ACOCL|nr:Aspartic proteinase PCS1 [Acorus calamus]